MASAGLWTQTASPCLTCLLIGLAAGFVPHGKFGGEPSFGGQPNGLWLWQTIAHPLNALSPKEKCCVVDCGRANALPGTVFYTSDGAWRELGLRGFHPGPGSLNTPIRPYTYAQTYLFSLFACDEGADHTYL